MSAGAMAQNTFDLKMLLVLSFGHLATDVCQSALPSILPLMKVEPLLSSTNAGIILRASNITSSVIQPLFGYWSDQKEKPFLLPAGCFFAGLGFSLRAMPDRYGVALMLVIISGLGIASYHPEGLNIGMMRRNHDHFHNRSMVLTDTDKVRGNNVPRA